MSRVPPREVVFRGRVDAAGLWLPEGGVPRALRLWRSGDQVLQGPHGVVLRFGRPRPLHTRRCWGVVLVVRDGRWMAAPLRPDELPPEPGGVWAVRGGRPLSLSPLEPVELGAFIDLGEIVVDLAPVADPPAPVQRLAVASDPFADVVPERAEPLKLAPELTAAGPSLAAGALNAGMRAARGMLGWLGGVGAGRSEVPVSEGEGRGGTRPAEPPPRGDSWWDRADRWLAQRMMQTGLGSLVGEAHARYLRDLMERLSRDALDEDDLKRAIPLGGGGGLGESLAGLFPGGRSSLDFRRTGGGVGGVVPVAEQLMDRLQRLYEQAVERLVAQERFDEAAYVLGELLARPLEAVALLEEHGRFRRAAELAEAKDLDPALVVRLHFLAGDLQRAIDIARRTGALGAVLERLEARDPEQAMALRMTMAKTLLRAGMPGAAVELVEDHVEDPRHLEGWRRQAVAAGGARAAAQLGALVAWHPDDARLLEAVDEVLRAPSPEPRRALAARLVAWAAHHEPHDAARACLRALWRAAQIDAGRGRPWPPAAHAALVKAAPTVVADRPPMMAPAAALLAARPHPLHIGVDHADRGLGPVHDAHRLADGRWLLARGEDGVELRGPTGALQRRWERPAHHLVVSDDGEVIVLTRRGDLTRLHRLRLSDGRARDWCDGSLQAWADRCGDVWFVGSEGRLMALDLADDGLRSVWSADLGGPVASITQLDHRVVAAAAGELWSYALPRITLRHRRPLVDPRSGHRPGFAVDGGGAAPVSFAQVGEAVHAVRGDGVVADRPLGRGAVHGVVGRGGWWALAVGQEVVLGQASVPYAVRARVYLEGAERIGVRLTDRELVACDDLGRVVSVALEAEQVDQLRS